MDCLVLKTTTTTTTDNNTTTATNAITSGATKEGEGGGGEGREGGAGDGDLWEDYSEESDVDMADVKLPPPQKAIPRLIASFSSSSTATRTDDNEAGCSGSNIRPASSSSSPSYKEEMVVVSRRRNLSSTSSQQDAARSKQGHNERERIRSGSDVLCVLWWFAAWQLGVARIQVVWDLVFFFAHTNSMVSFFFANECKFSLMMDI